MGNRRTSAYLACLVQRSGPLSLTDHWLALQAAGRQHSAVPTLWAESQRAFLGFGPMKAFSTSLAFCLSVSWSGMSR
jgi:hypothetical protein